MTEKILLYSATAGVVCWVLGLPCTREAWTYWRESKEGPQRWRKKGWNCLLQKREDSGANLITVYNYLRLRRVCKEPGHFQWQHQSQWAQTETEVTLSGCHSFLLSGWLSTGTGFKGRVWSFHPWRHSKAICAQILPASSRCPSWSRGFVPNDLQRSLLTSSVLGFCEESLDMLIVLHCLLIHMYTSSLENQSQFLFVK